MQNTDAKELQRRAHKSIGTKRLATVLNKSENWLYQLTCRSPDVKAIPPMDIVRLIMVELAALGDIELAAEIAAYLTQCVPEIQIARIYGNHKTTGGVNERNREAAGKND